MCTFPVNNTGCQKGQMQHVGCAYSLSCLKTVKWETEVRRRENEGEVEGSAVLIHTDKGDHELSIPVCHLWWLRLAGVVSDFLTFVSYCSSAYLRLINLKKKRGCKKGERVNTSRDRKEGHQDKAGTRRRNRRGKKKPRSLLTLEMI